MMPMMMATSIGNDDDGDDGVDHDGGDGDGGDGDGFNDDTSSVLFHNR